MEHKSVHGSGRKSLPLTPAFLAPVLAAAIMATVLASCAARTDYTGLYGLPAPPSAWADRVIRIGPDTRYVNVEGGQTVRFIAGDKSFAWHFMVAGTVHSFDLKEVAPPGILDHTVTAYVSPDPRYMRGP